MKESAEPGYEIFQLCSSLINRLNDTDLYPQVKLSKTETYAVMMAKSFYQQMIAAMCSMFYQPAQDYLAELWDSKRKMLVRMDEIGTNYTPQEYIDQVMEAANKVQHHINEGREMGLADEEIFLHDELWGMFMEHFDPEILKFAHEIYIYGADLYHNTDWTLRDKEEDTLNEIEIRKRDIVISSYIGAFFEKFKEIRLEMIKKGIISEQWLPLDSLAVSYIFSHAERKAYGRFN